MDSTSADRRVFEKTLGVAMLSTMVERREHFHFSMLAEAMTQNAALTQSRLASMIAAIQTHVPDLAAAKSQALALIAAQVRREANVMAYGDAFWIIGVGLILSLAASGCSGRRALPELSEPDFMATNPAPPNAGLDSPLLRRGAMSININVLRKLRDSPNR